MVEEKIGFDTGFFIKALQADETALNIWKKIKNIVWIDNMDIIDSSAKISYSNNIPAIDSIILASLLNVGVIRIYTTDTDLQKYRKKIISIILL